MNHKLDCSFFVLKIFSRSKVNGSRISDALVETRLKKMFKSK